MKGRVIRFCSRGAAFLLVVCLLAMGLLGHALVLEGKGAALVLLEVVAAFRDVRTQWMAYVCVGVYLAFLLQLRCSAECKNLCVPRNPDLWLAAFFLSASAVYAMDYASAYVTCQALILLGSALIARCIRVWSRSRTGKFASVMVVGALAAILLAASQWRTEGPGAFGYRNQFRMSGPWDNPNTYGLLVGTGVVLLGILLGCSFKVRSSRFQDLIWTWLKTISFLIAAALMVEGLLKSYSRGAWLATGCGGLYLGVQMARGAGHGTRGWVQRNTLPAAVILVSILALSLWEFRHTQKPVARRALSVGNINDFSWRNRTTAWEGTLAMMADRPWLGFGWNRPGPVYDNYYRPVKVAEGAAIEMNDYLMLGSTLGIPALGCFAAYLWMSLTRKTEKGKKDQNRESGIQQLEWREQDWLKMICRAGAIVLMVGFWFDGGLFKLATALTFWILLELGAATQVRREQSTA